GSKVIPRRNSHCSGLFDGPLLRFTPSPPNRSFFNVSLRAIDHKIQLATFVKRQITNSLMSKHMFTVVLTNEIDLDLVGREVTVELKNDLAIWGTLHSIDQYLNIKLENTKIVDQDKYPHMEVDFVVRNSAYSFGESLHIVQVSYTL
uniref:Sm domain-containing protein n=1 Tax=Solanum lycopersicum TaxID=4081 RepID=A0A3Q7FID0_SOLLC